LVEVTTHDRFQVVVGAGFPADRGETLLELFEKQRSVDYRAEEANWVRP
jgi:hypothetical protein